MSVLYTINNINNYDYKIYIDRKGHCIIYIYIHLSSFWYGWGVGEEVESEVYTRNKQWMNNIIT